MIQKVKVTTEQAITINELQSRYSNGYILAMHKNQEARWYGRYKSINGVAFDTLKAALMNGYEVTGKLINRGEPANMKKIIKIVRKSDAEAQTKRVQELETDYWLSSLYDALQRQDEREIAECKQQLRQLQEARA